MATQRELERETLQAMFFAAVAAQGANEPSISTNRLVAALLRTNSVQQFCVKANVDLSAVLADGGVELGSDADPAALELRPLAPAIKRVLDPLIAQHGRIAISPLQLLRGLIGADPDLASRLKPFGLSD